IHHLGVSTVKLEQSGKIYQVSQGARMSPIEAARRWTEKGYFVIPVPFRQKRPEVVGWPELRINFDDLDHYFSGQLNVGLLLGEPFGISDVDLDSPESADLWQQFAPPTKCAFGRPSKPFSHWLYHCDPPVSSIKFTDPIDKQTLLELRSLSN